MLRQHLRDRDCYALNLEDGLSLCACSRQRQRETRLIERMDDFCLNNPRTVFVKHVRVVERGIV